jgi:hypothetical protein
MVKDEVKRGIKKVQNCYRLYYLVDKLDEEIYSLRVLKDDLLEVIQKTIIAAEDYVQKRADRYLNEDDNMEFALTKLYELLQEFDEAFDDEVINSVIDFRDGVEKIRDIIYELS